MDWGRILRLPSALLLVGANLVPLVGVLALGWDLAEVMLLFWVESAIIGAFTVLKMTLVQAPAMQRIFMIPFFCMHFGIFMLVHLVFLLALFVGPALFDRDFAGFVSFSGRVGLGALALVASHAGSFWSNFVRGGEREQARIEALFFAPYPRVVALHLTIILGAFVVLGAGEPRFAIVLLVGLKIAVDLVLHGRERKRFAQG